MTSFYKRIFPVKFLNYWKKNRIKFSFNKELQNITDDFLKSKSEKFISNYWNILAINHYNYILKDKGVSGYGSSIARWYSTILLIDNSLEKLLNVFSKFKIDLKKVEFCKIHKNFTVVESANYNYICCLLFNFIKKNKKLKFLSKLQKKSYLNFDTPFLKIENFKVSSDMMISLLDYFKIERLVNFKKDKIILEIGAGSGRLSDCILTLNKNTKYLICDIVPSYYLSYKRLKASFPYKKICCLNSEDKQPEVIKEKINKNDIIFIYPSHLSMLSKKSIDCTICVNFLQEVNKKTVLEYFNIINFISKKLYLSVFKNMKNWYSGTLFKKTEKYDFFKGDYDIPNKWKKVFVEELYYPSSQICAGYLLKD